MSFDNLKHELEHKVSRLEMGLSEPPLELAELQAITAELDRLETLQIDASYNEGYENGEAYATDRAQEIRDKAEDLLNEALEYDDIDNKHLKIKAAIRLLGEI